MWSDSYKALIAWLCLLVPIDLEEVEPEFRHYCPFNVVGLQQMVIEGKLVLAIAAASSGIVDNKTLQTMRLGVKVGCEL